jgi:hypothetical protein
MVLYTRTDVFTCSRLDINPSCVDNKTTQTPDFFLCIQEEVHFYGVGDRGPIRLNDILKI